MNTRNINFPSNRFCDVSRRFHQLFDATYGKGEVDAFLGMLCEEFLGWNQVQMLLSSRSTIDQSDLLRFHWALEDLKANRPIQHIIGHCSFAGLRFEVNPDVLIPRPETEEMVLHITSGEHRHRVLDLCTGSGCIAIAIKNRWSEADVVGVDVSSKALSVARRNAEACSAAVKLMEADVLHCKNLSEGKFDLIVANPPYVRLSERAEMMANVVDYEPDLALFVPDADPLLFYRAIAAIAQESLDAGGMVAVEINEALPDETAEVFHERGFSTALHDDFRGRHRWIEAHREH